MHPVRGERDRDDAYRNSTGVHDGASLDTGSGTGDGKLLDPGGDGDLGSRSGGNLAIGAHQDECGVRSRQGAGFQPAEVLRVSGDARGDGGGHPCQLFVQLVVQRDARHEPGGQGGQCHRDDD